MAVERLKVREFRRREEEILKTALDLFSRKEWQLVTMDEIAGAAGVAKGSIYKHFPSKDDIYARILIDDSKRYLAGLREVVGIDRDVISCFRAVVKFDWEYMSSKPDFQRKLAHFCEREDFKKNICSKAQAELSDVKDSIFQIYEVLVRRGIDLGLFPPGNLSYMVQSTVALFDGTYRLLWDACMSAEDLVTEEYMNYLIEFTLRGWGYATAGPAENQG